MPSERCVIERTEDSFTTRFEDTSAANDWLKPVEPWEARVGGDLMFSCSFSEAGGNSRVRREALAGWEWRHTDTPFAWVRPPVLNKFTRIATEMCPAEGILRVIGYEQDAPGNELPQPATLPREITTRTYVRLTGISRVITASTTRSGVNQRPNGLNRA